MATPTSREKKNPVFLPRVRRENIVILLLFMGEGRGRLFIYLFFYNFKFIKTIKACVNF